MYHRVYAKINLDNLDYNIKSVVNKIGKGTKLLAVIKADAYGHGAVEVGKHIENVCDFFGVACIEEALELVKAGIKKPVLVLGYVSPYTYKEVVKYGIRIPVFSFEMAKALSEESVKQNALTPFHFAIDTGMSRIGFQVTEESADICEKICALPGIEAEGLFSHFATADEKNLDKALLQRDKYKHFVEMLKQRNIEIPIKHLNNSAGIMNFDEEFDMVRSGIITYGLYPSEDVDKDLLDIKPVMSLISHVSHIKTLEKGREISYGGTYVTKDECVIATIPVGYADGYPRCLSNIGKVIINGKFAPVVGRVCMDQFMVDITGMENVDIDTSVVLVGSDGDLTLSMEEVSNAAHSFNYELPCRIAHRVPRVYYQNKNEIKTVSYLPTE